MPGVYQPNMVDGVVRPPPAVISVDAVHDEELLDGVVKLARVVQVVEQLLEDQVGGPWGFTCGYSMTKQTHQNLYTLGTGRNKHGLLYISDDTHTRHWQRPNDEKRGYLSRQSGRPTRTYCSTASRPQTA